MKETEMAPIEESEGEEGETDGREEEKERERGATAPDNVCNIFVHMRVCAMG